MAETLSVPKTSDRKKIYDEIEQVSSDESLKMAKDVIKLEGIPVGISSGAAIVAAIRQASKPENAGKKIVVIIPSYTERYLSTLLADTERKKASELVAQPVAEEWLKKIDELYPG